MNKMGPELGKVFEFLWNECSLLNQEWAAYVELYGTSEERLNLLNGVAYSFSRVLHDSLWQTVLLRISRLTEHARSRGDVRLTLASIPPLLALDPEQSKQPSALFKQVIKRSAFVIEWRNRLFAHREASTAFGDGKPLPLTSRNVIAQCIQAIGAYLNCLQELHGREATPWKGEASAHGARNLLYVLRDGSRFDALEMKWKKSRSLSDEDFADLSEL